MKNGLFEDPIFFATLPATRRCGAISFSMAMSVHYPENLEKNAQKFVVCHFERSEKSFAFGVSAKSEDLSLRSR
uniref:Uncharacterized protein n=1 Tax=Candidatus Kentrum sp. LFY TaxID=2126342 RepID=A0A450U6B2_9GAMM|nr:MAG: hypothetical protein BECKLFY1418B_GA0070995_100540 [Candidatus Kentron sp. LFY]